jgi:prepilin-type N-terminal cleavage/methylation domain-containing protein
MFMRSMETNAGHRRHRASGFSLIEMVIVLALIMVLASITFINMVPVMKQQRINNAYNTTLSAMRQARDNAVSQRTSYKVTFTAAVLPASNTIKVEPTLAGGFTGAQSTVTYQLPTDVSFAVQSGFPSPGPDLFGTGTSPIDFGYTANGVGTGTQNIIYFCPDGSAQDAEGVAGTCAGSWDSGVVYIGRPGELLSSRAITLWGGTGRVRGWRLYAKSGGGYQWLRQ